MLSYLDLAKSLFEAIHINHNGTLDFTYLMAPTTRLTKLLGRCGRVDQ